MLPVSVFHQWKWCEHEKGSETGHLTYILWLSPSSEKTKTISAMLKVSGDKPFIINTCWWPCHTADPDIHALCIRPWKSEDVAKAGSNRSDRLLQCAWKTRLLDMLFLVFWLNWWIEGEDATIQSVNESDFVDSFVEWHKNTILKPIPVKFAQLLVPI